MKRIGRLLSCIRYHEVLVLQGAPAMGCILAMEKLSLHKAVLSLVFLVADLCLVAHMWSLNDWADRHADAADESRSPSTFTHKGVDPTAMLGLSFGLLLVSLTLFACLPAATFWIAVGLVLLSVVYSFPGLHAKSIPVLASLPHLAGGFLHFLLGYSLFAAVDPCSLRIAVVFALVFTAGHGVQEVQDHDADRRAGIRTNAVIFGKSTVFGVSLAAFLFVYAYLAHLATTGVLPPHLALPVLPLAGLHLGSAGRAWQEGLSAASIRRYRDCYRVLFGLLGLCVLPTLFR